VARKWNLFELTQFSAVRDLARLTERASRTTDAKQLADDPAFQSLKKDPRFRRVLEDESLRAAALRGDYATLLRSNAVLQLVQDPDTAARIRAAAEATE
jgi:membrane protein required for colicin V production